MKKIKLKFYGLGYKNYNQAYIYIYDEDRLIFENATYNNEIEIYLQECKAYKLLAISNGKKLITSFFVDDKSHKYIFSFDTTNSENIITFLLTDFYYENLPIERGELLLWQKQ